MLITREPTTHEELLSEIERLRVARDAVILAHNYQIPAIQDLADFVGDSLGLARAAAASDAERILFCGVHFMAESAAILSPDRRVLIPDLDAGCSLADSISAEQLRGWKAEHPDAVVVSYVNTSAEVKALTDYCCTSSNAVAIVESIPPHREILFLPDMYLGHHVQRVTGRENMHIWMGECHVHAALRPADIESRRAAYPEAEFLIHPECGCTSSALYHSGRTTGGDGGAILSTEGMIRRAERSPARQFVVATEIGILHRMAQANPDKEFVPLREDASCHFMKMITLPKLYRALRDDQFVVTVDERVAARARLAIERMVEIG